MPSEGRVCSCHLRSVHLPDPKDGSHATGCPMRAGRMQSAVSRCNGYREDVERPCTGSLWAAPGDRTARCDTCNGQVGMGVLPDHWPPTSGRVQSDELTFPVTYDGGRQRCVKPLYRARNGDVWEPGGGHFFASEEGARRLATGDYDATIMRSSLRPVVRDA